MPSAPARLNASNVSNLGSYEFIVSYDEALLERLKQWRLAVAKETSMPAFVVFTDATLVAIAESNPRDNAALLRIPGVGATKLERYGEAVLRVLAPAD